MRMRSLLIKYGFSADPSLRSQSSRKQRKSVSTAMAYTSKKALAMKKVPMVWSDTRHLTTEDEEGSHSYASHHHHLADEQQELLRNYCNWKRETSTFLSIPVDELQELFKAPEAAAAATKQCPYDLAVCLFLHLVINIFQNDSDHAHNGNDEGPKGQRPCVVPARRGVLQNKHGDDKTKNQRTNNNIYLKVRPRLMLTANVGTLDLSNTQYQEAKAPASTISPKADTKNMDQKSANKLGEENCHHTEQSQEDELQDVWHDREEER
ncbi:hypothetical protein E2C01_025086 [Portunus trituberculatus]|uniref:Uncharacterized protein n=1 Tax=Portunus trituberculatus TaxID=210409 RepID=A0A5B7ECD0_PORTR|nr:hypothetical protein [Portunus trituberculatus]